MSIIEDVRNAFSGEKHNYEVVQDSLGTPMQTAYGRWVTVTDKTVEARINEINEDIEKLETLESAISSLSSNLETCSNDLRDCYRITKDSFTVSGTATAINEINDLATNMATYNSELSTISTTISDKISELQYEKRGLEPKLTVREWVSY